MVSLAPLHKVLLGDLSVVDTIQLLVISQVAPLLCAVVAAHDAIPGSCELSNLQVDWTSNLLNCPFPLPPGLELACCRY